VHKGVSLQAHLYYVIMFFALVVIYPTRNPARSKAGRSFVAIRDNDSAAEIMGVKIHRYKLLGEIFKHIYRCWSFSR